MGRAGIALLLVWAFILAGWRSVVRADSPIPSEKLPSDDVTDVSQEPSSPPAWGWDRTGEVSIQDTSIQDTQDTLEPAQAPNPVGRRVGLTLATSLASVVVGTGLGVYGAWDAWADSTCTNCWSIVEYTVAGAAIGAVVGLVVSPLMVNLIGDDNFGQGELGGAYYGLLGGVGAGTLVLSLGLIGEANMHGSDGTAVLATSIAVASLLAIAGPVVGYEISDANVRAASVVPTVSVVEGGATLGAAGAF